MSQAPYMPVFVDALIGATVRLSTEQFGAYCFLLFATWSNHGNPLPDDDRVLARICHCTPARWRRTLRPALIEFFDNADGYFHQKRLEKEWKFAADRSDKLRRAGAMGGKATALKLHARRAANATATPLANSPASLPPPNLNLNKKERESLVIISQSPRVPARAIGEPDTKTRPSPSFFLEKDQARQAEPAATAGEIPEGWLAAADAAREEAGLDPVNLPAEWAKFATRTHGNIEQRRWIEWSLRAWVGREPKRHASASSGPAPPDHTPETPWPQRMRLWHRDGWWREEFGPKPNEPGCYVPPQFLAEPAE